MLWKINRNRKTWMMTQMKNFFKTRSWNCAVDLMEDVVAGYKIKMMIL